MPETDAEAAASLAIGVLLIVVAVVLIRADKDLMIGQAARLKCARGSRPFSSPSPRSPRWLSS